MIKLFQVCKFIFSVSCPEDIPFPDNFLKFETDNGTPAHTYRLSICEHIALPDLKPLYSRPGLTVYRKGEDEIRVISIPGEAPYALSEDSGSLTDILICRDILPQLSIDTVFSALFSFERHLLKQDALILHCCFTDIGEKALLFSGPSGTGKSTQGDLWVKHRGARVLNGDRAVIDFSGERITANAFPVCGSSGICHPGCLPAEAMFLPVQAPVNEVSRLTLRDAYARLFSQFTMNGWDRLSLLKGMDLIDRFVKEISIYELKCTISEEAVEKTEEMLG